MITVADIIALPAFSRIRLLAPIPHAGSRPVHNVGIMDVSPEYDGYNVYVPGEFIVTNLGFANGDSNEADAALVAMMARGVSAIAIKTVYNPPITDRARKASEEFGVPVYIYDGAYHEMVAYQALDLIRRDEQESNKSEAIDELLAGRDGKAVRRAMYDIAGATGSSVRCVAIATTATEGKGADDFSLHAALGALRQALPDFVQSHSDVDSAFACRYHGVLLLFVSYDARVLGANSKAAIKDLVASIGPLSCGFGDEVPLTDGDLTVRQALALLELARERGVASLEWFDAQSDAFTLAAKQDRLFVRTSATYLSRLRDYDSANDSELEATAEAFVNSLGDIKVAADELFQHPNTVRYRLRKIKALMGMPEVSDRELMVFLTLVFLGRENEGEGPVR